MASYTFPKIGQKVKVSYDAWSKCYPGMTTFNHCNDIGIITEIEYSGFRLEDADYKHHDTIYTVTFLSTIFEEERHVYARYDDLIFNPCQELTPVCAQTRYVSPHVDCCGRVYSPCSGEIVDPFERLFPADHTKSGLPIRWVHYPERKYPRIEPKCKGYSPSLYIIDELSTYDPMKKYIKNDVEMTNQTYLYHALQSMKPVEVVTNFTPFPETTVELSMKNFDFEKFINRIFDLPDDGVKEKDPLIKTVKISEKEKNIMSTIDFRVKKIMHNGPATIVFWKDGTKTVVRLKEGDKYDPYAAFTAAVAKRVYGKTVKISEIVDRYSKDLKKIDIPETPPSELSVEELKAAADKLGYRVSKKPKK